jgi:hypothetical protein
VHCFLLEVQFFEKMDFWWCIGGVFGSLLQGIDLRSGIFLLCNFSFFRALH